MQNKYAEIFERLNILDVHAASLKRDIDWLNGQCAMCNMAHLAEAVATLSRDLSALRDEVDVIYALPVISTDTVIPPLKGSLRTCCDVRLLFRGPMK